MDTPIAPAPAPTAPSSTLVSIGTMLATKGLSVLAGIAVTHGLMTSSNTETFVSAGLLLVSLAWSGYVEYGRPIILAQLEVLKAKSLAQAAALKAAGLPKVTVTQIAAQSPTMDAPAVAKAVATLPPEIKATVAPSVLNSPTAAQRTPPLAFLILLAIGLSALALAWAGPASAQTVAKRTPRPPLTGNIPADINNAVNGQAADASANALNAVGNALAKPFQDLANFIGDDSAGAVALATAIPELQDGHGQQCWMAMKQFGEVAKAHPVPLTLKLLTDVEAFRLMGMAANNLCANPHCTQVFADMSNAVEAMSPINSIPIPSLNALCSKVPQVSVAPPVPVPPAAPATPAAQ